MSCDVVSGVDGVIYRWLVKDQPFNGPVEPTECKHRLSSDKRRIVFTLKKMFEEPWPQLHKKEMNQHTGWN